MWNLSVIFFSDCFPPCLFFSCNPRGSLQCGLEGRAELLPTSAPRSWRLLRSCLPKLGSAVLFMHQTCLFLAKRRLKCCVWGCPSMLQTQQRGLQHWCYSEQLLAESQHQWDRQATHCLCLQQRNLHCTVTPGLCTPHSQSPSAMELLWLQGLFTHLLWACSSQQNVAWETLRTTLCLVVLYKLCVEVAVVTLEAKRELLWVDAEVELLYGWCIPWCLRGRPRDE